MHNNPPTAYIWWLGEAACRQLGEPIDPIDYDGDTWPLVLQQSRVPLVRLDVSPLPGYIKRQYTRRYGRAGRGRLWVEPEFQTVSISADDRHPIAQRIREESAGGIVIHAGDLAHVRDLPGFVTDTQLNVIVEGGEGTVAAILRARGGSNGHV